MTALLIRRRRPVGEVDDLVALASPRAYRFDGTANTGRIRHALAEVGRSFPDLVQVVLDVDATADDVANVDIDRSFSTVILGSHLVNVPDEGLRLALLSACARHVGGGNVLIEHHPVDWASMAGEVVAVPGGAPGMVDIRSEPPFVSAVTVYDTRTKMIRQPFTARVLSESELERELEATGLFVRRRLSPTWIEAEPIEPRRWSVAQPPNP